MKLFVKRKLNKSIFVIVGEYAFQFFRHTDVSIAITQGINAPNESDVHGNIPASEFVPISLRERRW